MYFCIPANFDRNSMQEHFQPRYIWVRMDDKWIGSRWEKPQLTFLFASRYECYQDCSAKLLHFFSNWLLLCGDAQEYHRDFQKGSNTDVTFFHLPLRRVFANFNMKKIKAYHDISLSKKQGSRSNVPTYIYVPMYIAHKAPCQKKNIWIRPTI